MLTTKPKTNDPEDSRQMEEKIYIRSERIEERVPSAFSVPAACAQRTNYIEAKLLRKQNRNIEAPLELFPKERPYTFNVRIPVRKIPAHNGRVLRTADDPPRVKLQLENP